MNKPNNFAYIDGNNLYRGTIDSGWKLDYCRFRQWLTDKYDVSRAYYFIGMTADHGRIYNALQRAGFFLVFKEVVFNGKGEVKGNCDAELVLQSAIDAYENNCDQQVIVSSDGDYACLVRFLLDKQKLRVILSPRVSQKCSVLLKRTNAPITYLQGVKEKLIKMKKPSLRTKP